MTQYGLIGNAAASGGIIFHDRDVTEFTTTSTSKVTAATLIISVSADTPIYCFTGWRKTAGAVSGNGVFIDLNSSEVLNSGIAGATNQAEDGQVSAWFGGRTTNYLRNGSAFVTNGQTGAASVGPIGPSADMPTAPITQLLFSILSNDAAITSGMDNSYVFSLAIISVP